MAETVNDIIGKGFKYEERVDVETIIENLSGTKTALAGVANWGPVDVPTRVINNFKSYFGSEINRDDSAKDYSGFVAAKIINLVPSLYFTRITDGTDRKSSLKMTKLAKSASFTGAENVQGKSLKVTDATKIFKVKINDEPDSIITLTKSAQCAAIVSAAITSEVNFNVGDYIEFFVDGLSYQYIINNANDILCKLTGSGKYDDSYYGGQAGQNIISFVDRIIYAVKNNIIGAGDASRIVRKVGTNQISINSNEVGSSSTIKITNFPIVFANATTTNPLTSSAANTGAANIVDEIKTALTSLAAASISSDNKFQLTTLLKGAAAKIFLYPIGTLDRNADFDGNIILGAGDFSSDPTSYWSVLNDGLIANLGMLGQIISLPAGTSGVDGTRAMAPGTVDMTSGHDWTTNEAFRIAVDGGALVTVTLNSNCADQAAVITEINAELTTAGVTGAEAYDAGSNHVGIRRTVVGLTKTIQIAAPTSGANALTTLGITAGTYAGTDATAGYADIAFSAGVTGSDKCGLAAGTYVVSLNINGGGAANHNIVVVGNETWDQFAALIAAISGVTAAVISGNVRITSDTTGASSSVVVAEGTGLTAGLTLTYSVDHIVVATLIAATTAKSVAQRFTVSSAQAYQKMELYFVPSGTATGEIKVDVLKGQEVIGSKTITAADVTAGLARITFYAQGAGSDYRIAFRPVTGGVASSISIDKLYLGLERAIPSNDLLDFLGIKDNSGAYDYTNITFLGEDANLDMGTLQAKYTGSDGNKIYMVKSTELGIQSMEFYTDTTMIGKIVNFSYTVADDLFFGNMINNDSKIKQYLEYVLPSPAPTVIGTIPDGTYQLGGGSSGIGAVVDAQYASALEEYKNQDIFDVDIMTVVGNSTAVIISKIDEICKYRKDCFGIVDPPEAVAGKPGGVATGGVDQMIYWHNGQLPSLLNMKLDSKYLVTYFPWVLVSTQSVANSEQWMPPSIAAIPSIIANDKSNGHTFGAPAGKYAKLSTINDIAYYLTEEDKGRVYDDNIGNNINPIVYTSRQGFFIDGQKTTQRERNAYNRINVMRVSLFMKRKLMDIVPNFFYGPIIKDTKDDFEAVVKKEIMEPLVKFNAIKPDYSIDMTQNTDVVEASLGMIAVLIWSPIKSIEKIKVISFMKDKQVVVQF